MRIAVPLYGPYVAPRFCSAEELLVVDVNDGQETSRRVVPLHVGGLPERLAQLAGMGVQRLYCGGFNGRFLPLAGGLGVQVRSGLTGAAEDAVRSVCEGREPPVLMRGCGRGMGRRRGARGRGPRSGGR